MDPQVTPKLNNFTDTQGESYAQPEKRPPLMIGADTGNVVIDLGNEYAYVEINVVPWHPLSGKPYPVSYGTLYAWAITSGHNSKYTGPITAAMKAEIQKWV